MVKWSNGQTIEDPTGLSAGTYIVTITDANGCVDTTSGTVTSPSGLGIASFTVTDLTCNNDGTGAVSITVSGGIPNYTYAWSNGGSMTTISNLAAGTYAVTVTDANNCTYNTNYTVSEPTAVIASNVVTNVDCNGNATGSVDLTASGGTGMLNYAWSDGSTMEDLANVAEGTYYVTITDANACVALDSATVTEPTALATTTTSTDDTNNSATGSAIITTTGGTPTYTYAWSNGATTDTITGLGAGTYYATVTDMNNCTAFDTVTINNTTSGIAEILVVGSANDLSGLSLDERDAYSWAFSAFPNLVQYASFTDVANNNIPTETKVIWYHLQSVDTIRPDAANAAATVETFVNAGGGLLLTGHGTQYAVNTNVTTVGSNETITNTAAVADSAWGFRPLESAASHPVFAGLPASIFPDPNWSGFRTVDAGTSSQETISWWTQNTFPGTKLAGLPWLADDGLTICGELSLGFGKVLVASAPGYAFGSTVPQGGQPRQNLELFTTNMLNYLYPSIAAVDAELLLLGSAADASGLSRDVRNVYDWALSNFTDVAYAPFASIAANGVSSDAVVVWYHLQSADSIPTAALAAQTELQNYINNGGRMLLSGHATQYVPVLDATVAGPNETIKNTAAVADSAWGFRPITGQETHPYFTNLSQSFFSNPYWGGIRTVDAGTQTQETISWWTGGSFPGTQLASLPWLPAGADLTTIGDLNIGNGQVCVVSAPGFAWGADNPMMGQPRANLELLTENILNVLGLDTTLNTVNIPTFDGAISVYPNPIHGQLNIDLALDNIADATVEIYSLTGRRMRQINLTQTQQTTLNIDMNDYAAGIYFVRVIANGQSITQKVLLTK